MKISRNTTCRISALALTLLALIVDVLAKGNVLLYAPTAAAISPILFVAAILLAYLSFKDSTAFTSKWVWLPIILLAIVAASSLGYLVRSIFFFPGSSWYIIAQFLFFLGASALLIVLLFKESPIPAVPASLLMPASAGSLAVAGIFDAIHYARLSQMLSYQPSYTSIIFETVLCLVFLALTLMHKAQFSRLLRFAVIVLSVLCISQGSINLPIALAVLAILMVPFGKPNFGFSKLAAILLVCISLFSIYLLWDAQPFYSAQSCADDIAVTKQEIADKQAFVDIQTEKLAEAEANAAEKIPALEEKIKDYETKLSSLEAALRTAKKNMTNAENNLDKVCSRESYSYWYCSYQCRGLHDAVETAEEQVTAAQARVTSQEASIESVNETISILHTTIEKIQSNIAQANAIIDELKNETLPSLHKGKANGIIIGIVHCLASLTSAGALVVFAIFLWNKTNKKLGWIACMLMAAGRVLALFYFANSHAFWSFDLVNFPFYTLLARPELWSASLFLLLGSMVKNYGEKMGGKRIAVILLSILTAFVANAAGLPLIYTSLYTVFSLLIIGISFLLSPFVFTEYNNIGKHIFLSLITFGVWVGIWIFNVTKNLNKADGVATRKPVVELLLCVLLPFYGIYWIYKTAEAVEAFAAQNGKPIKLSVLCLALCFVCPLIPSVLIQEKINGIVGKPE